jgi:hypothetical protein
MTNLLFSARQALFSQPIGMTFNVLIAKLSGKTKGRGGDPAVSLAIDELYGIDTGGR